MAPDWAERPRAFVPELDDLDPAALALDDLGAARTLWVIATPAAPRSSARDDLARLAASGFLAPRPPRTFGALELHAFEVTAPPPRAVLSERLADAEVSLVSESREVTCAREGARHVCPGGPWMVVASSFHEVDRHGRRCVWAHPPARGESLRIALRGLPPLAEVSGGAGFASSAAALAEGLAPVALTSRAGAATAVVGVAPGDESWKRFRLDAGGATEVVFEIRAADPRLRHFCFDAVLR